VESGFPSENATNAKMLKRFLFPVSVKPLWASNLVHATSSHPISVSAAVS
jgi:hypothetical protein